MNRLPIVPAQSVEGGTFSPEHLARYGQTVRSGITAVNKAQLAEWRELAEENVRRGFGKEPFLSSAETLEILAITGDRPNEQVHSVAAIEEFPNASDIPAFITEIARHAYDRGMQAGRALQLNKEVSDD